MRRQPASNSASRRSRLPAGDGGWACARGLPERIGAQPLAVEALQHLVDEDPESLVDRRLLRDREHPRELVLQRAGPVEVDVGGGQRQAVATAGDELLQRGLAPSGDQLAPRRQVALLADHVLVQRRRLERRALLRRGCPAKQLVERRQCLRGGLGARALDQRRELDQLQVARHRLGHVLGRVQAHLREGRARPPGRLEDLVAKHPVGRVEPLGGPEQLLGRAPPPRRPAHRGPPRRTGRARSVPRRWSPARRGPGRGGRGSSPGRRAERVAPGRRSRRRRLQAPSGGGSASSLGGIQAASGSGPAIAPR